MASSQHHDRAYGALMGMAIGDALGMPSQTLSVEQINKNYGEITDFVAPFDDHPVSHGLVAGQVTDDTEQTLMLGHRLILGNGQIDETQLALDLLAWEADVKARGLRDLLGPSTKAALDALIAGVPISETGRAGTTNGAAMRIAPVGIAFDVEPIENMVGQVELACRLTHNTGEAIAAAAAVAAVISCGLNGQSFEAAIPTALRAAEAGQKRGHAHGVSNMPSRILSALNAALTCQSAAELAAKTGTSVASHESVPAAFGLVRLAKGDPWQAAVMAANIGDDTDTIGAIAGAMAGACLGIGAFPERAIETIQTANELDLKGTAHSLLELRNAGAVALPLKEAGR